MTLLFAFFNQTFNGNLPFILSYNVALDNLPKLISLFLERIQHYQDPVDLQFIAMKQEPQENFGSALNVLIIPPC